MNWSGKKASSVEGFVVFFVLCWFFCCFFGLVLCWVSCFVLFLAKIVFDFV